MYKYFCSSISLFIDITNKVFRYFPESPEFIILLALPGTGFINKSKYEKSIIMGLFLVIILRRLKNTQNPESSPNQIF